MRAVAAALLAGLLASCATTQTARPAPPPYPGNLLLPSQLGDDFMLRQTLEADYGDQGIKFSAVLQKTGDSLLMLGLTPFGTRAFKLEQTGEEVSFEKYVPKEMPFPPRYMLLDLQRTLFIGLPGPPHADGEHCAQHDGETITETWSAGALRRRTFRRDDATPPGAITIDYGEGMRPGAVPKTIRFDNGWFGYSLVITTTEQRKL